MPRSTSAICWLGMLLLLLPTALGALEDPFHSALLDDGIAAYVGSDLPRAEKYLRLANFGLLEQPELLAKGLTYLCLVYASANSRDSFERAFARLLEIENRFSAYTQAPLPQEARDALARQLTQWSDYRTVRRYPAFGQAARALAEQELDSLEPAAQLQILRQRMADEPQVPRWALLLANLEIQEGSPATGLDVLNRLLERSPGQAEALCLRSQAAALAGRCSAMENGLEACTQPVSDADTHLAILSCYLSTEDYARGQAHLSGLPSSLRRKVPARISRGLRKGLKAQQRSGALEQDPEAPAPGDGEQAATTVQIAQAGADQALTDTGPVSGSEGVGSTEQESARAEPIPPPPASPPPPPSLSAAQIAELDAIQNTAAQAKATSDLEEPIAAARRIADAHPLIQQPQHIVGELAYRAKKWDVAVEYLRRGGSNRRQPELDFYLAVALEETGRTQEAAVALEGCLPSLEKTEFVSRYVRRILGRDL